MNRRDLVVLLSIALIGVMGIALWQKGLTPSVTRVSESSPQSRAQVAEPEASARPAVVALPSARPEDQKKLDTLDAILASRNDNDPRLDTELRVLSEGAKELMKARYRSLSPEKRNERGTVVFLVGRNLTTEADFDFLCEVVREPPCLSLKNCNGDPGSSGREDFDREAGEEVTLAYPQLVAIHALQAFLSDSGRTGALAGKGFSTLDCAKDSRVPTVVEKAGRVSAALTSGRPSGP